MTSEHPIDNVEWVDPLLLDANDWNPNRVFTPELRLLEESIVRQGWIQPILVSRDDVIIDGFHRWRLGSESTAIRAKWGQRVPIVRLDLDRAEAMMLTVRINRAKGKHVARFMSDLVQRLIDVEGCTEREVADGIGATPKEVRLLHDGGVFKVRNIDKWAYSPAWYPVERETAEPSFETDDVRRRVEAAKG